MLSFDSGTSLEVFAFSVNVIAIFFCYGGNHDSQLGSNVLKKFIGLMHSMKINFLLSNLSDGP